MLIRQQAFTGLNGHFLKGGLHCHTTRSDGKLSPEETIRLHAENGYDFLALTDHRYYNFENYAPDTDVLIIPGMEIDVTLTNGKGMCYHTVALGPEADKNGYAQDERVPNGKVSCAEEFQPYVDELIRRNNIAMYCHPDWSRTPARLFENLKGYFGMEIWNSGCVIEDDMDVDNGLVWDELLVEGHRLYATAVDDGHKKEHHCKGWVMVNAEKNVGSILSALQEGKFYSSCGPMIYDFYVEDDFAYCVTSPVKKLRFITGLRPTHLYQAEEGQYLTRFKVSVKDQLYTRLMIEDENGCRAWSNPIFLK